MPHNDSPVIECSDVSFRYNSQVVLEKVTLSLTEREFIWIVGPNGGGKTTLLKLLLGMLHPQSGTIRVFGRKPQESVSLVGYMAQQTNLDPQFPVSVLDVTLMGRLKNNKLRLTKIDKEIAEDALQRVGLVDYKDKPFSKISGGQQRRTLIARSLATQPKLLLLDEPTTNLDIAVEEDLFELLHTLSEEITIVMASHDPAFVSRFVRRVVCVNRTVAIHPTSAIEDNLMSELYGRPVRMIRHDRHQEDKASHG